MYEQPVGRILKLVALLARPIARLFVPYLVLVCAYLLTTSTSPRPSAAALETDDLELDSDETDFELTTAERMEPLSEDARTGLTTVADVTNANNSQGRGSSARLNAPVIGSSANPFSNTCDGKAIGFFGPTGERPRMEFRNVPPGAVLECRSAPSARLAKMAFSPCDGGNGTKPFHYPALTSEGKHRTEVRYTVNKRTSATTQVSYYVHRSLDRVACCQAIQPDQAWLAAARSHLKPTDVFTDSTQLDNPFITIAARTTSGNETKRLLSLRRTFRLSADRRLLLIRRTMASRRTFEKTKKNNCVGLSISVPKYVNSKNAFTCDPPKMSKFLKGRIAARCPDIYCTVTTCRTMANGCIQVTHTFNRGPGQKPWVVRSPPKCPTPSQSVSGFEGYQCDAYVLNRSGQGVCLVNDRGTIRAAKVLASTDKPLGLKVLAASGDHYVFSAKSKSKRVDAKNVLYLPE